MLQSDWYRRLTVKQGRDVALWTRHVAALDAARVNGSRLEEARLQLARVSAPAYLRELEGTIGADPFHGQLVRLPSE
jgi:phosphoenolpyruvate carboxykinase (diphosphate)